MGKQKNSTVDSNKSTQLSKRRINRNSERGNVFFTLFGAVAVVGVLGAGIMSTMRGPLSTMVDVNRIEQAKSEARLNASLVLAGSDDDALEVTCASEVSGDGFTEGPSPTGFNAGTGRGTIPANLGASLTDPWGTPYEYCTWNHGPGLVAADTDDCGGVLEGSTDQNNIAIAVISAGPDGIFQTTCTDHTNVVDSYIAPDGGGGDDIINPLTYSQAVAGSGGLWTPNDIDNEAEIARSLDVTGGASFTDNIDLRVGAASMFLPTQAVLNACDAANDSLMRINTTGIDYDTYTLEICENGTGWVPASAAGVWEKGTADDIYYDEGTPQVGIGTGSPDDTLDVVGTMQVTGDVDFDGALDVAGDYTSTLGDISAVDGTFSGDLSGLTLDIGGGDLTVDADGNTDTAGTLDVTGATTLDSTLDVVGDVDVNGGNFTIDAATGNTDTAGTLDVTGATTLDSTLDVVGDVDVNGGNFTIDAATGNTDIGGTLDVAGDVDINDNVRIDASTGDTEIDGTLEADDYTWGNVDFTPTVCASDEFITWKADGWKCRDIGDPDGDGDVDETPLSLKNLADVNDALPTTNNFCLVYDTSGSGEWTAKACDELGLWEDFGTVIRISDSVKHADHDFVFGSDTLIDASVTAQDARFFFDKSQSAFAAGIVDGAEWDAPGAASVALGQDISVTGDNSFGFGLGDATAGSSPVVSASNSLGIFMGAQSAYDLSDSNVMALVGGTFLIDDDGTDAAGTNGCIRYNAVDSVLEYSDDCADWNSFTNDITGLWTDLGSGRIHYGTSDANQVGVGTDNPQVTLDVGGTLRVGSVTGSTPNFMALNDLSDATITTPADGECLTYNGGAGAWENVTCAGVGGKWVDGATPGEIYYNSGLVGIGTIDPSVSLTIVGTDAVLLPAGLDGERPTGVEGMIRYNTTSDVFEGYVDDGTPDWEPINTGVGGKWIDAATPGEIYYDGGNVGVGTVTDPAVALDVGGTLRIADGAEACIPGIAGAIRYSSSLLQYCDGTVWRLIEALSDTVQLSFSPATHINMDVTGSCGTATCTGTDVQFVLSNQGTLTSDVIAYTIGGDSANFVVTNDTCTGITLAANASCQIDIQPSFNSNITYNGNIAVSVNNSPNGLMQGTGSGFGCAPGVSGGGGVYVSCGGMYDTIMTSTDISVSNSWGGNGLLRGTLINTANGPQNTVNLALYSATEGGSVHQSAELCNNLVQSGFDDWYLPSLSELTPIRTDADLIAGAALVNSDRYQTSTESNAINSNTVIVNGTAPGQSKTGSYRVRCFRRDGEAMPTAQLDTIPDAFSFTDVIASGPGRVTSNAVTMSNMTGTATVSISGDASATFRINGGAEVTSGSVIWGDTIDIVMDAPADTSTTNTAILNVGGTTGSWTVSQSITGGTCDSTETFTTPGIYTYNVPANFTNLTVRLWGGGGAGGNASNNTSRVDGLNAQDTSVSSLSLVAGGGQGGQGSNGVSGSTGQGGAGGIASGGDTNINGEDGGNTTTVGGVGGDAPSGGGLGGASDSNGSAPGGGGGGDDDGTADGGGGGSGAYVEKTYTTATLTPGSSFNITVGSAGLRPSTSSSSGRDGADGQATIICGGVVTPGPGATFTASLDDTPIDYTGAANSVVKVNNAGDGLEFAAAATDAVLLPAGLDGERPTGVEGMIRYNTTSDIFEGYVDDGTPDWEAINTGVGGKWIDGATSGEIYYDGGNVGVGTVTDPAATLDVGGDIQYTGTLTDLSDRRLKTDIAPLSQNGSILERISQIDTYSFVMKDDADKRTEFGVMAQELEPIFPELVHTASDEMGTKSVNYVGLIAPIIEATKELRAENVALKAEITALKAAQAETNATLSSIDEQVQLLSKISAANTVDEGSMQSLLILLLGLMMGGGIALLITRKNHNA